MKSKNTPRHIPIRTCIVSRKKKPKKELIRLARDGNKVLVDCLGKVRGRGANICMDLEAFDKAVKKHLIEKALKLKRSLTEDEVKKLRNDFESAIDEKKFRKGKKPITVRITKDKKVEVVD